jgi:hypothetical protein
LGRVKRKLVWPVRVPRLWEVVAKKENRVNVK